MTFLISLVFGTPNQNVFQNSHKTVILSEAPRGSIASQRVYSAESKDPGDACWQMLLGAFRPQTIPEDKNVTNSNRSDLSRLAVEAECREQLFFPQLRFFHR